MLYRKYKFHYMIKPILYVPLKKIPRDIRMMAVRVEDANFYEHFGIQPSAMYEAFLRNHKNHRYSYGASTINQQLARTLFLLPAKNIFRKYLEIIIAVEMNLIMKKDRILEIYLNTIEWGKGIFGIGRASIYYYGKNVNELNGDEKARLIAILSSPIKYNPDNLFKRKILSQRYYFLMASLNNTNQLYSFLTQTNDFSYFTNTNTILSNDSGDNNSNKADTTYLSETNTGESPDSDIESPDE